MNSSPGSKTRRRRAYLERAKAANKTFGLLLLVYAAVALYIAYLALACLSRPTFTPETDPENLRRLKMSQEEAP